jgi:hypothetical protein
MDTERVRNVITRFRWDLSLLQTISPNDYFLASDIRRNRFWSHNIGMDRAESASEVALDSVDSDDVRIR